VVEIKIWHGQKKLKIWETDLKFSFKKNQLIIFPQNFTDFLLDAGRE